MGERSWCGRSIAQRTAAANTSSGANTELFVRRGLTGDVTASHRTMH
jgi:hypothetical protein